MRLDASRLTISLFVRMPPKYLEAAEPVQLLQPVPRSLNKPATKWSIVRLQMRRWTSAEWNCVVRGLPDRPVQKLGRAAGIVCVQKFA
jgi:hypothetical protein